MKTKLMLAVAVAALSLSAVGVQAKPDANIVAAVADKGRPENDTKVDVDRKPAEMMEFAGVKPGQTVVDFLPGGGYFTRIFSKAVGPKGVVYAVSGPPRPVTDPAKPPPPPAPDVIAADPAYANVKSVHVPIAEFAIPAKADLVWTSRNYHDLHNVQGLDLVAFDRRVLDALKPGGIFIVLDHAAAAGTDATQTMHRIDPAVVRREVEAAGFKFEGESKALLNPDDDHTKPIRDAAVSGRTDQFIYKFRKPK